MTSSTMMGFELLLLSALIFMFIVSFCGLLQKIKQSHERERIIADRIARRHETASTNSDSFVNTTYVETESTNGIFPGAPPPYSQMDSPPKYEDIIKSEVVVTIDRPPGVVRNPPSESGTIPAAPPPYTISI
ncbi:hypothetical protein JTB14_029737 [Gonioctena quinquepunctata]|nr:hypothetical protein JTB14_029737 [Gonioctena quinquepunctata]